MAKKEFILQGFTKRTHGDAIRELFDIPEIKRVVLSVAFITESGVKHIENKLQPHAKSLTVFVGIRNDISTHQGLKLLQSYGGNLYAVDTGARNTVFHPKFYMVRNEKVARLVIGSANLTLGGLNNNIEASMLLEFDLLNNDDRKVVESIENEIDCLSAGYPENVIKVTDIKLLDDWLANGRTIDEMAVPAPRPSLLTIGGGGTGDTVPRIKLKVVALRRALVKAKIAPKKLAAAKSKTPAVSNAVSIDLELVWKSKPLKRRSLTIPAGPTSNQTGSATLGKGSWFDIDPATYFRSNVFGLLPWHKYTNQSGNSAETATAVFSLVVKNVFRGNHTMKLTHSSVRVHAAAKDHNSPTEISWGTARQFIAREELIGWTMYIFRSKSDNTQFLIEIDEDV